MDDRDRLATSATPNTCMNHEPLRVAFVSLGCAKNLVDSEKMLGQLAEAGCALTSDEADADVVVINTCGFLEASRTEAIQEIRRVAELKPRSGGSASRSDRGRRRKKGRNAQSPDAKGPRIVVAGCLVQRDGLTLLDRVEGIDALVGVHNRDDIVAAVLGDRAPAAHTQRGISARTEFRGSPPAAPLSQRSALALGNGRHDEADDAARGRSLPVIAATARKSRPQVSLYLSDYHPFTQTDTARLRLTPRHHAYVRISEGCDQKCTFCTIPSIRGAMHSKPVGAILAEVRELIADGAVEISLIGQDTTSYGQDIGDDGGLASLLRTLDREADGARWIRLMYVYPSVLTDEMIDAIAESERIVKYIDIPLQHINDRVLKSMHRRINRAQTEALLARLRERVPGVSIRTTMIAGFPGETDAEFEDLVAFIRDFRFDALGVFAYSLEPETPAGRMSGQCPDTLKRERVDRLMAVQQDVAFSLADERIGSRFEALVDRRDARGRMIARHAGQAPEVDAVTYVSGGAGALGEFIQVRCSGRDGYDLVARPVTTSLPVGS